MDFFPAVCSLDAYFLYSLWSDSHDTDWKDAFESELRTSTDALKRAGTRVVADSDKDRLTDALGEVRSSLAHLINHRLAAGGFDSSPELTEHAATPAGLCAEVTDPGRLFGERADVLAAFIEVVSRDAKVRRMLVEDAERTWDEIGAANDRLRQLGRYQVARSCFISYAHADTALAEKLAADLRAAGVRCWFAPDDILPGRDFPEEIEQAVASHECTLVLISETSSQSDWVRREAEAGLEAERRRRRGVVIPIDVDETLGESGISWVAHLRRTRHAADFTRWQEEGPYRQGIANLLRALRSSGPMDLGQMYS